MKRQLLSFLIIYLLVSACDTVDETDTVIELEPKKVQIHYKTGVLFCEGTYRVFNELLSEKKQRIGFWIFNHPDGTIHSQKEYDKSGELINYKEYNVNGILTRSIIVEDNITITTEYYSSGKVEFELIEKELIEYDGEYDYTVIVETEKTYYESGGIKELREYIDGGLESVDMWDEDGDLILEIEYEDGIIKEK